MKLKDAITAVRSIPLPKDTSRPQPASPSAEERKQMRNAILAGCPNLKKEVAALSPKQLQIANSIAGAYCRGSRLVKLFQTVAKEDPPFASFLIRMAKEANKDRLAAHSRPLYDFLPLLTDAPEATYEQIAWMSLTSTKRDSFIKPVAAYVQRARIRGGNSADKRRFAVACLNEGWEFFIEQLDNGNIPIEPLVITGCVTFCTQNNGAISSKQVLGEFLRRGVKITAESIAAAVHSWDIPNHVREAVVARIATYAGSKTVLDLFDHQLAFDLMPQSMHLLIDDIVSKAGLDKPNNYVRLVRLTKSPKYWDRAGALTPKAFLDSVIDSSRHDRIGAIVEALNVPTRSPAHEQIRRRAFSSLDLKTQVKVFQSFAISGLGRKAADLLIGFGTLTPRVLKAMLDAYENRPYALVSTLAAPTTLKALSDKSRDAVVSFLRKHAQPAS